MNRQARATAHAALGDEKRLLVVDLLLEGDRTVRELAEKTALPGNLLAHHLDVLEGAGLIARRVSEGDRRRRYVLLLRERLSVLVAPQTFEGSVLFVCSHNSARSQYAAARWKERTGRAALSAGSDPAATVHPLAIRAAADRGLDISGSVPRGYDAVTDAQDLMVSVCDRARESELPPAKEHVHWSVADPVLKGSIAAFREAFSEIDARIEALASGQS